MISANLDELSPLLRTAFVLREVEGYSTGEAAKKLGVTENTLKARLWRARHQLAERLGRRLRRFSEDVTGAEWRWSCSRRRDDGRRALAATASSDKIRANGRAGAFCAGRFVCTSRMFGSWRVKVPSQPDGGEG